MFKGRRSSGVIPVQADNVGGSLPTGSRKTSSLLSYKDNNHINVCLTANHPGRAAMERPASNMNHKRPIPTQYILSTSVRVTMIRAARRLSSGPRSVANHPTEECSSEASSISSISCELCLRTTSGKARQRDFVRMLKYSDHLYGYRI